MRKKKEKKAQEEMIGFVLIVLLLLIIGLIFFAFSIRKPIERESGKAASFLDASLLYTTNCTTTFHLNIKEIIKSCFYNEICLDGRNACDVLQATYEELLTKIEAGKEKFLTGYKFNIDYTDKKIKIEKGECKNYESASRYISIEDNIITIKLDICYETAD